MDVAAWLGSLPSIPQGEDAADAEGQASEKKTDGEDGKACASAAGSDADEPDDDKQEELVEMGFPAQAVAAALEASGGDVDEALGILTTKRKREASPGREAGEPEAKGAAAEPLEIEGIQCNLTDAGELVLHLPHDPATVGPVVGRQESRDGGLVFDGMDDWLSELYTSRVPRPVELPPSFDAAAVAAALDRGAAYVWDSFATNEEIEAANQALNDMHTSGSMSRGSDSWAVDECGEGGHARNRQQLKGQQRRDACGFWNLWGEDPARPAPPPAVFKLFQRLEAAGERLRAVHGWPVLVSDLGMGAVYDGEGACYSQHRDNEWQRHLRSCAARRPGKRPRTSEEKGAWMNFRELTMLAYVNLPGQFGEDESGIKAGGRLRCYTDTKRGDLAGTTATELQDVAPLGGRAVIFRSRDLLHEVLPSFARRFCLTLWFCTAPEQPA